MRGHITAYDIANEIRMTRSQHLGSFLIVEGQMTDLKLYERFIDSKACKIIPAHGKENALDALDILEQEKLSGIIAIVDADFWHLEDREVTSLNLMLTDTHDLETMIINSSALEKVLREFASDNKVQKLVEKRGKNIREILLEAARPIGYLRWFSLRNKYRLKFEGLVFGKFINDKKLTIDTKDLIKTVKNKSERHDLVNDDLQREIDELVDPTHNLWDLCCGHDLVCILSLGLCKAIGSNKSQDVKPELLEKVLRIAYEFSYFSNTNLYESLKKWEARNQPFRVFPIS